MIQRLDLSCNAGLGDAELAILTKTLVNLGKQSHIQGATIKHLNISALGASPSALSNLLKSLPLMTHLSSLDLSNNPIAFFCADAFVTSLKAIESMPTTCRHSFTNMIPKSSGINETRQDENRLLKLNLSGTKLDELTAYQLCQGILQHSLIESLDLSNNV